MLKELLILVLLGIVIYFLMAPTVSCKITAKNIVGTNNSIPAPKIDLNCTKRVV